jgi:hypothetical protein
MLQLDDTVDCGQHCISACVFQMRWQQTCLAQILAPAAQLCSNILLATPYLRAAALYSVNHIHTYIVNRLRCS